MTIILLAFAMICISLFLYIIGRGTKIVLKLNFNHEIITGIFVYIIMYGLVSVPLALFHVSWSLFFTSISLLNLLLVAISGYLIWKKHAYPNWSIESSKKYMYKYWPVIFVIILYIVFYLMSDAEYVWSLYFTPIWDNSYYTAKANSVINNMHILNANVKTGEPITLLTSLQQSMVTWELLWSYIATVFGLTINQVSKFVLPFFIYTGIIFTYEIVFEDLCEKISSKKNMYRGYLAFFLIFLLFTNSSGTLQGEAKKFLFSPWFGNVIIILLFIPTTFYFLQKALSEKKWLYAIFSQMIFYNVFSSGALAYIALTYPVLVVYWYFKKEYTFKNDKLLLILSLLSLIFLNVFYIFSQSATVEIESDSWRLFFEMWQVLFILTFIGVVIGIIRKSVSKYEQFFFGFLFLFLAILLYGKSSNFLFSNYKFVLHRYGVSITLMFMIYGCYQIFQLWKFEIKTLFVIMASSFFFLNFNYDLSLVINRNHYHPKYLFETSRESKEVVEAAKFLNEAVKTKKREVYYCMYAESAGAPSTEYMFLTKYNSKTIILGSSLLSETRNVYITNKQEDGKFVPVQIEEFIESKCDYMITDSSNVKDEFVKMGAVVSKKIEKDITKNDIYIVDVGVIKEDEHV